MQDSLDSLRQHQPLNYAAPGAFRRSRRLRVLGFFSFVVSILSLLLCGFELCSNALEIWETRQNIVAHTGGIPNELEARFTGCCYGQLIFVVMFLLALLLLAAARKLWRSDRRGLTLHWMYIPLQMLASVALAVDLMWIIYCSPAGMVFYIGAIPGLVGCAYPLLLIPLLLFAARRVEQTQTAN